MTKEFTFEMALFFIFALIYTLLQNRKYSRLLKVKIVTDPVLTKPLSLTEILSVTPKTNYPSPKQIALKSRNQKVYRLRGLNTKGASSVGEVVRIKRN